jgi:hypothetical protein
MNDIDQATWHEKAHVRGMALEYALGMLQRGILDLDNYLPEAARYWHFLAEGNVMNVSPLEIPDDLGSLDGIEAFGDLPETGVDIDDIPLPPEPQDD